MNHRFDEPQEDLALCRLCGVLTRANSAGLLLVCDYGLAAALRQQHLVCIITTGHIWPLELA